MVAKLYYRLTAWIPRPLPTSQEDIPRLKHIFIQAFGLEDSPQVWYTIFANMASVKSTSSRVSYGSLATIARRLEINKVLQDQKALEHGVHLAKLQAEAEKALEEAKQTEPDRESDLQLVQTGSQDHSRDL